MKLVCLFLITVMITIPIKAPEMRIGGCLMTQDFSGSLVADCSNSIGLDLASVSFLEPETLNLSFNGLVEVPAALNFSGFENLKHLDLSWNNLTCLPGYKVGTWNNLTSLGSYKFRNRLKSLNISHNRLTNLPAEKPLGLSIDVSYNNLTNMSSIFGLVNTNATVRGNQILCKCNSGDVKYLLNHVITPIRTEWLNQVDCILHDEDVPRPISIQCFNKIDRAERPNNYWLKVFYIIAFIITVFFLIIKFFGRTD